jgi:hypothetical protein
MAWNTGDKCGDARGSANARTRAAAAEGGTGMRDPDLTVRAQVAASALEGAWRRWRVVHGSLPDPMPAVSSYVGYSLQEPWGQPRVVFGLAAEDAEQLAALLERHDYVEPAYAALATQIGGRDPATLTAARGVPMTRQAPGAVPAQLAPSATAGRLGQPVADMLAADSQGFDEPLYRQVAAAMQEATAGRESADLAEPYDAALAEPASFEEPVTPEWMGSLARAASAAKAEAEARIKATLTDRDDEPAEASESGHGKPEADDAAQAGLGDADAVVTDADQIAGGQDGRPALPHIQATDVLEPLPTPDGPDAADGAGSRAADEAGAEPGEDGKDLDAPDGDAAGHDGGDQVAVDRAGDEREAGGEHEANGESEPGDDGVIEDVPERDGHEVAASAPSGAPGGGSARRSRAARSYPISRLSRTKRPGASNQPAG